MIPLSIDEAAVEVEVADAAAVESIARSLQSEIRTFLRLPASLGVSPYRTVAKIASDRAKPAGVVVVPPSSTQEFLGPLPIASVPGVGPKTAERLKGIGVERIADLLNVGPSVLRSAVGSFAGELLQLAQGTPSESEWTDSGPHSRSCAETFVIDVGALPELGLAIDRLADALAAGLEGEHLSFQTVTVGVRWNDFQRVQRSQTVGGGHRGAAPLRGAGRRLVAELWHAEQSAGHRKVRTLSLSAERLRSFRASGRVLEEFAEGGTIKSGPPSRRPP